MIKEAINRILELGETKIIRLENGREFSTDKMYPIKEEIPPMFETVTLTSIMDYIHRNQDKVAIGPYLLHVRNPNMVRLMSPMFGMENQRATYMTAEFKGKSKFVPDRYYSLEEFCILLQTAFFSTQTTMDLLRLFGNVRGEEVAQWEDDGVTQTVTTRKGVALVENVKVPSPVVLQPYRTFHEIEQPPSLYIVRMKSQKEAPPLVTLVQADGDEWEMTAMNRIGKFFKDNLYPDLGTHIIV